MTNAENPYIVREQFSSMTVNHWYGITPTREDGDQIDVYLANHPYALLADLKASGIDNEDIEAAVNGGSVMTSPWPLLQPVTDLFWVDLASPILDELADRATEACGGMTEDQPVGGDFISVGAAMGSQQTAIVGLIRARDLNKLWEIPELGNPHMNTGPFYVAKGGYAEEMFRVLLPDLFPEDL